MLSKLRLLFVELGGLTGLFYLLNRALNTTSGGRITLFRYWLTAQSVLPAPRLNARRAAGFYSKIVAPGDWPEMVRQRPAAVLQHRLDHRADCLVVYDRDDDPAGYLWLARDCFVEDEVRVRYQLQPLEQWAWDFDVYIPPERRLGFTFAALWDAADSQLREWGLQGTASRVSAYNTASIRAHQRQGARIVGALNFLVIGRWQLMFCARPPYVHLGRESIPTVNIPLNGL